MTPLTIAVIGVAAWAVAFGVACYTYRPDMPPPSLPMMGEGFMLYMSPKVDHTQREISYTERLVVSGMIAAIVVVSLVALKQWGEPSVMWREW